MWAVRSIKSAAEIERLRVACQANEAGFAAGFGRRRAGAIEQDVAAEMFAAGTTAGTALGAWVQPGWIGMTSGPGGYARFVSGPRRRAIAPGDMLWADLGFTADGYWSDYCRAAVVGGPTPRQIDRQRRIDEATSAGIEMLRPGVAVADVARTMRATSARLGLASLGFGRLGHGIGLTATEPPSVNEHDATILVAGMVVTVEPAATEDDGLYCAEQIVVVGDPPRLLSTEATQLRSI
jgi:Xaa-Pro aminopeptidase